MFVFGMNDVDVNNDEINAQRVASIVANERKPSWVPLGASAMAATVDFALEGPFKSIEVAL